MKKKIDIFEKSRLALRKHILANKEKVKKDLEDMRKKSENTDYRDILILHDYLLQTDKKYREKIFKILNETLKKHVI